jgi:hypothetical protein
VIVGALAFLMLPIAEYPEVVPPTVAHLPPMDNLDRLPRKEATMELIPVKAIISQNLTITTLTDPECEVTVSSTTITDTSNLATVTE